MINNGALSLHFNEVYIAERCVWSRALRIAETNYVKKEQNLIACMRLWKVLFSLFREIFPTSLSQPPASVVFHCSALMQL